MGFYIAFILTILWFLFMNWLSYQNGDKTLETSMELAKLFAFINSDATIVSRYLRRSAHIVLFAILTILLGITLYLGNKSSWILLLPAIWGYVDECTKPLVEGRHFSWFDVGLNLVGVAIGNSMLIVLFFIFLCSL